MGVVVHAAAHGFKSDEWRALALPVGEGIIGRCAETGTAIRVDDVRADPRSARRDVDEREGIRSMLCVPLRVAGALLGVISAFSTRPAAFSALFSSRRPVTRTPCEVAFMRGIRRSCQRSCR